MATARVQNLIDPVPGDGRGFTGCRGLSNFIFRFRLSGSIYVFRYNIIDTAKLGAPGAFGLDFVGHHWAFESVRAGQGWSQKLIVSPYL